MSALIVKWFVGIDGPRKLECTRQTPAYAYKNVGMRDQRFRRGRDVFDTYAEARAHFITKAESHLARLESQIVDLTERLPSARARIAARLALPEKPPTP